MGKVSGGGASTGSAALLARVLTARVLTAVLVLALTLPAGAEVPPSFRDAVPERESRWTGEPVSMSLRDADLVETLRSFARLGDFNLLLQPGVRGNVTVELRDVPWDQAMSMILRMHGLGMEMTQGTIRIGTQAELLRMAKEDAALGRSSGGGSVAGEIGLRRRTDEARLRLSGKLEHLDAAIAVSLLKHGYLSERGQARSQGPTLVIEDGAERVRRVARLIAALDEPQARGQNLSALRRRATQIWPGTREATAAKTR